MSSDYNGSLLASLCVGPLECCCFAVPFWLFTFLVCLCLQNIIGQEASKGVIEEYLQRRGQSDLTSSTPAVQSSRLQTYMKPLTEKHVISGGKKQVRTSKDTGPSDQGQGEPKTNTVSSYIGNAGPSEASESRQKGIQGKSRKKKAGKVVSLAEAAKGSFVFQQGKPCPCQARQHRLVSNCLSCGKIVCEQEGEGPCSFCGALVLKEGSTYAGLEESMPPISDAEFAAEAYAKRLVDYDRNSAARTTVIDDQSDYYEIEGNSWLSNEVFKFLQYATYWLHLPTSSYKQLSSLLYRLSFYLFFLSLQEKQLLRKKQEETEEAEQAKRNKVVVTFDLVGRKVLSF